MTRTHATLIVRAILSLAFIVGYGFAVAAFLGAEREVSEAQERILVFLFGALTTSVVTVVNYWFASSQGSADKTAEIVNMQSERTK
jgi:uncharacterized membrane protein required for colicin V production